METMRDGTLKIWMSGADMRRWGLRFEKMSSTDKATRAAVSKLLQVMRTREFLPDTGGITVEAIPLAEGCLLLFTPRVQRLFYRFPAVKIFTLANADAVLRVGAGMPKDEWLPPSSLYEFGGGYRLIVYAGWGAWQETCRAVSEFAEVVGEGAAVAAVTEEHGTAIAVGDALNRLREAF